MYTYMYANMSLYVRDAFLRRRGEEGIGLRLCSTNYVWDHGASVSMYDVILDGLHGGGWFGQHGCWEDKLHAGQSAAGNWLAT